VIEPLRVELVVRCPPDHAFTTFTEKASAWWPAQHTMSGERGLQIVFEPRVGGRIFERTPAGAELEWGEVTVWERPRRLGYLWHIATERADATDVEITFTPIADGVTRVEIVHGGWDRMGEKGRSWRDANRAGWDGTIPSFVEACARR
jgi:hypothetical protein